MSEYQPTDIMHPRRHNQNSCKSFIASTSIIKDGVTRKAFAEPVKAMFEEAVAYEAAVPVP